MIIFYPICGISITNPPISLLLFISLSLLLDPPALLLLLLYHSLMYSNIEHIFFSAMPNSDLFFTKENPEDVGNLEKIKPTFQFQKHFLVNVPNCSESPTSFDSPVLKSSTWLENPISNHCQSQINQESSSQPHSRAQKEKKKGEEEEEGGGGGSDAAGPLLLSKENCKLNVEDDDEEEEEDGFRTPTSLDHRIPEANQCPPAPRKPKPSLKRKAPHSYTTTPLHLSKEFQILFPPQHNPSSNSYRITCKKVRRDDPM